MSAAESHGIATANLAPVEPFGRWDEFTEHSAEMAATVDQRGRFTAALQTRFHDVISNPDINPDFHVLIKELVETHDDRALGVLYLSIQKQIEYTDLQSDPKHPQRDTPEQWDEVFNYITEDDEANIAFRVHAPWPPNSNLAGRYKVIPPLAVLSGQVETRMVDAGSSANMGLHQLGLQSEAMLAFDDVTVVSLTPAGKRAMPAWLEQLPGAEEPEVVVDHQTTDEFNSLIHSPKFKLGDSVGLDLFDPYKDDTFIRRVKAHSQRMEERATGIRTNLIELLTDPALKPPQVDFSFADITGFDPDTIGRKAYDIYNFGTVLYELDDPSDLERQRLSRALQLGRECSRKFITMFDFVKDFDDNGLPTFYHGVWPKWSYSFWYQDVTKPKQKFNKLLTIDSGRTNEVIVEPAMRRMMRIYRETGRTALHG